MAKKQPQAKRVDNKGGPRTYVLPPATEGGPAIRVPSVTSILQAMPKPALVPWAAKREREMTIAAAVAVYKRFLDDLDEDPFNPDGPITLMRDEIPTVLSWEDSIRKELPLARAHVIETEEACAIGTAVHAHIEAALLTEMGRPLPEPLPPLAHPQALEAFSRYQTWRDETHCEIQLVEEQVWSRTHGYAGTLDWFGYIKHPVSGERIRCVADWKTSKAIFPEYGIQNAAYVKALAEMGHCDAASTWGCLVRLPKTIADPGFEVVLLSPETLEERFNVFLSVYDVWRWENADFYARQCGPVAAS